MSSSANPYLKKMSDSLGLKDPTCALQAFVSSHRSVGESLDALARRLGVSRIVEQRMPYEGGLFRLADGELVIKLNSDSSFVRKRFTLAHEIAHLLLDTIPAHRSGRRTDALLERTCDAMAAELLMPTKEATDFVGRLGAPTPEGLKVFASTFGVSLQAAAIRICSSLGLWKYCAGSWSLYPKAKTLWFVGPKKWQSFRPAASLLERASLSDVSIQARDLWGEPDCSELVSLSLLSVGTTRVIGLINYARSIGRVDAGGLATQ